MFFFISSGTLEEAETAAVLIAVLNQKGEVSWNVRCHHARVCFPSLMMWRLQFR